MFDELGHKASEVSEPVEVREASADSAPPHSLREVEIDIDTDDVEPSDEGRLDIVHESSPTEAAEWSDEELEDDYTRWNAERQSVTASNASDAPGALGAADVNEGVPEQWNRIEGEHDIESDASRVNPCYVDGRNGAYENNCPDCAATYEMRRRGYDVEARPLSDENRYLARCPEAAWENPDIQVTEGNGKADIEQKMQEWGDGARAEVIVYWKQGQGHAFSAEQVDGKTRFVDSQPASDAAFSQDDVGDYFDYVRDDGSTYFWRTDNIKPSENIEDCCKEVER